MHTIAELMEAAAIKLGSADLTDLGRTLGVRRPAVTYWMQAKNVPRKEYCVPIARALGVDADYVMACLEVARRRDSNLAYWRRQASREIHATAIDAVNALLAKVAETYEKEGRRQFLLARTIRSRAHSVQAYLSLPLEGADSVHAVPELIYALHAKFGHESDSSSLGRALGVSKNCVTRWHLGEAVPTEENALSLAKALGIDPQYALACLAIGQIGETEALARPTDLTYYGSSIRTVNSLLEKSATHYENEASLQMQRAERLRARLSEANR